LKTVKEFGIKITHSEFDNLLKSFPGRNEGDVKRINIARLYDQKYSIFNSKMYGKVDVFVSDGKDEPVDAAGYTGQFLREKLKLKLASTYEILGLVNKNKERLSKVWLTIRHIDKQRNGYVTNTELDDILKEVFPELMNYDLSHIYQPFASIQNKVLIEHKKFQYAIIN
jgi:Ca2+-binding EF-hand superfamily protein